MKIRSTITLLLACLPLLAHAVSFKAVPVGEGLSNRRALMCCKDNDGYLWIATRTGIDRYDGEAFENYILKSDGDNRAEHPKGIICTEDGSIIAYSDRNLWRYSWHSDSFLPSSPGIQDGESISSIAADGQMNIWIGTTHHLYLQKKDRLLPVMENVSVYSTVFVNAMHGWAGTSKGIFRLSGKEDGTYMVSKEENLALLDGRRVQTLFYDRLTHFLWIGTFNDGTFCYNMHDSRLHKVDTQGKSLPVRTIETIGQDCIWAGMDGAGIFEYNRFDHDLRGVFSQEGLDSMHLPANSIYDIEESGGSVWICTYTSGILACTQSNLVSRHIYNIRHNGSSLRNDYVNCILEDRRKRLWFGTNNGISRYDPSSGRWKHFLGKSGNEVVLTLCEDMEGNVWAGGYACDVVSIDTDDNVRHRNEGEGTGKRRYIYSICQDSEGTIWMGGIVNGLTAYNPSTKSVRKFNIRGINHIIEKDGEEMAIASQSGVLFLDRKSGNVRKPGLEDGFPDTNIQRLGIIPEQPETLWIGTEDRGVISYDMATGEYRTYSTKDGLSSDNICGLQYDNAGRMWIGTENGLNCISLKHNRIESFHEPDGLPDKVMNLRAHCLLSDGNIMWGTPSGAFEIKPDEYIWKEEIPYNLRFREFALFNTPVSPGDGNSPLSCIIDRTEKIVLSHDRNSFSFKFLNIGYQTSNKYQYTWMLEGFDRTWCSPTDQHQAVYTNIPPGKYSFRARVQRGLSPEDYSERSISITVRKPWWNTWGARLLYLILIACMIYYMTRMYMSRIEARDSDQKIRFFVNLAHDIRTPLTLVKAPLCELADEPLSDNGRNALGLAQRNTEKLLNMVTQLLDFQKLEREAMSLHVEETDLTGFISGAVCNFEPLAKEKGLKLHTEFSFPEHTKGFIDQRKVSMILDNLISNSVKYTPSGGNVRIRCSIDSKDFLSLEVTDDGIGISREDQKKLFNRFYRGENAVNSKETGSGIGLLLTRKMSMLHKGDISFYSTIGAGTTFIVRIPVSREAYSPSEIINPRTAEKPSSQHTDTERKKLPVLMIVEDNEELRTYLSHYMESDYRIVECADGKEALETVHKENPDFIVSDVMMPVLSGIDLCRTLKADIETCHIPVILLTSLAEREDIIKGLDAGADDYITKPFDLSVLKSKIAGIIHNRALYHKKFIDRSALPDDNAVISGLDRKFMEKTVDYIEENMIREDFSIDTIALEMAMSRSVFFKKIKALTGQSPQDLVRDIKMKKAAGLLEERKYSIGEIAYLTGFPNAKYFSTAFKKYYGKTPSEYV